MKNVLTLAHDDSGQEARLQAALDLTRFLDGHLRCLDVAPVLLPLVADPVLGVVPTTAVYDGAPREDGNSAMIKRRLAGEDVAWEFDAMLGEFAAALVDAARTADIVVLNKKLDGWFDPNMPSIAGELLIEGNGLLLAVGDDCRRLDLRAPVIVAWDGSESAMRTLQRAVPLLKNTTAVTILQVGTLPDQSIPAEDAASYLSRHGIKAEIEIADEQGDVSAQILRAAAVRQAGAIVMGAFGHSRLREAVFGGVTRTLLRAEGVPLILGH